MTFVIAEIPRNALRMFGGSGETAQRRADASIKKFDDQFYEPMAVFQVLVQGGLMGSHGPLGPIGPFGAMGSWGPWAPAYLYAGPTLVILWV